MDPNVVALRLSPPPRAEPRRTLTPATAAPLDELLRSLGTAAAPGRPIQVPVWRVLAGAALLREDAPARALHVVRSGSFKCVRTLEDGYEQVTGFADRGDVLGFEALHAARHPHGAVALEDATTFALPLAELAGWRHDEPALDRGLLKALSAQLAQAGEVLQLMAAVSAEVRLARFLAWWSARMQARGRSPLRFHLRMSRRDIASFTGVAHETVSRSFGTLAAWGLVRVHNREVEILDAPRLRACARSTRGLPDEPSGPRPAAPRRRGATAPQPLAA